MTGGRRAALTVFVTIAVAAGGAGPAHASAVYNLSENGRPSPAPVVLDCGLICGNRWNIPAGQSRARPGKGGPAWVDANENWGVDELDRLGGACEDIFDKPNLANRGWQELHKGSGGEVWLWRMFGNGGARLGDSPIRFIKYSRLPGVGCAD